MTHSPINKTSIAGVIFDLDGVLVSTDELHYRAWQEMADREGIPFDRTANHRLRGISRMASLEVILEKSARSYSDNERAALAAVKNERFRELLTTLTPNDLAPGARELLDQLRQRGVRIGIASSSRNAPLILEMLGVADEFDAVVDGNQIEHSKPHPQVFLLAAQCMQLDPAQCVAIEDAAAGVESARRAGMAVVGIGSQASLPGVTPVFASISEVTIETLLAGVRESRQ